MLSWASGGAYVNFIDVPNYLFVFELDYKRVLQPQLCITLNQPKSRKDNTQHNSNSDPLFDKVHSSIAA